ncbi:MAG: hypothetical protein AB7O26_00260 [Planctomycetaceae bacterium]
MTLNAALRRYCKHVLYEGARPVGLRHRLDDVRRMARSLRTDKPVSTPPHSLALYRDLLTSIVNDPRCKAWSLAEYALEENRSQERVNVVLRHDLDAGDPHVSRGLCEVERALDLRSSVHILVDGQLYDPVRLNDVARELHAEGFDVGLHTQAWMHEDFAAAFHRDLDRFESLFGFSPRTFSQHGAWPRTDADLARRRRFTLETPNLIRGTTLVGAPQSFDWVSEDSCVANQPVPITTRFFDVASGCFLGGVALILTHDNHWKLES